jgi:hypothetical protein
MRIEGLIALQANLRLDLWLGLDFGQEDVPISTWELDCIVRHPATCLSLDVNDLLASDVEDVMDFGEWIVYLVPSHNFSLLKFDQIKSK